VTFQINSYAQRVLGANRFTNFQEQELTDHATAMVLDLERVFPADRVLRVFGAVFRILDLVPYGLWASIAVLIALYLTHPRHALFVSFVLLGFVGYVSLIFQARHYFHLMVVPLWMIGVVVHHGAMWARPWMADGTFPRWPSPGPAGRRLGVAALVAIACVATLVVLRSYQQSQVLDLIGSYERHVTFAPFAAVQHTLPDGRPGVAVEQAPLPEAGPGVFRSSYVVADVECLSQNDAEVTRVYATPEYFRHEYRVPCSMGQRHWRMWVPVYEYGSRWRFQGLEWRPADQIRVQQIRRVADLRATPLLLTLVLPDNWREQRYFHVLSWTALRTLQPWRL
jgi:hypothetical protein